MLSFTVYKFGLYSQLVEFRIKILKIRSGQFCMHCPLESEGKKAVLMLADVEQVKNR